MSLLRTYSKIMIIRNRFHYLRTIWSIIFLYVIFSFTIIFIDSILTWNTATAKSELHYLLNSILTVIFISGITIMIYQFYTVMKSGMKDYSILRGLGATNYNIRFLNMIQMIFLIIVSIPIGLLCGYSLTKYLVISLNSIIPNHTIMKSITSTSTLLILAGIISSFIISIGVYLDRSIRRMTLSGVITDTSIFDEEI